MVTKNKPTNADVKAGKEEQSKPTPAKTEAKKEIPKPAPAEKPPIPKEESKATSKPTPAPPKKLIVITEAISTSPVETKPEQSKEPSPKQPPTLESLYQEIQALKNLALQHAELISQLQETLSHKRKPVTSNGKIQIKDKKTGEIYPSKNNAYQSLLKAGELKDLVDKGLFGPNPIKNTFGWYTLSRLMPDRFGEIKEV